MPTIAEKFQRITKARIELTRAYNDCTSEELRLYGELLKKYQAEQNINAIIRRNNIQFATQEASGKKTRVR